MAIALTVLVLLLITTGYVLFTQKHCYVHHTALLHTSAEQLFAELTQLEHWNSWQPWSLYDASISAQTTLASDQLTQGDSVEFTGSVIGTIHYRINHYLAQQQLNFIIDSNHYYACPIEVSIDTSITEDQQIILHFSANANLPFWRRYQQRALLKQLHADLHLMLIRLMAKLEDNSPNNVAFAIQEPAPLDNLDAVTRPFIVSDQSMSMVMEQGFKNLHMALGPENPAAGPSFTLYETVDPKIHYFTGRLGIPVHTLVPCEARAERITFKGQYISLRYQGNYHQLGLAWHVLNTYCQLHGLKRARRRMTMEVYEVSLRDTEDEMQFVTVLYLPIL